MQHSTCSLLTALPDELFSSCHFLTLWSLLWSRARQDSTSCYVPSPFQAEVDLGEQIELQEEMVLHETLEKLW